ncbi:polysaccharide deacetylase family protein [Rummeliibacillus pycnus]|uniref:polysaccharide deacetylase family protein n=1 Tax=Rummeliibacillus pycnus TaxID=101070 RepID=UPI000C9CC5A3|nr:polysaccharide deacetylase family protein [Rummeliibacillus pycnus]
MINKGGLIISLDFELKWGVHDVYSKGEYDNNLIGSRKVIPRMLELFEKYGIHATWATVGLLYANNKQEMEKFSPEVKPSYKNQKLSPYPILRKIGENELEEPLFFGSSLVKLIGNTENQELATHTFSHYYCLEPGQKEVEFQADMQSALCIADKKGYQIQSIVFPRNQVNKTYLQICKEKGIKLYRGNENHWIYEPSYSNQSQFKRWIKLVDTFLNLTGQHFYKLTDIKKDPIYNIPASAFLRSINYKLPLLKKLRYKRITESMTLAAKNQSLYHLWWHPHNMGKDIDESFAELENILQHYVMLKDKYQFNSYSMKDIADLLDVDQVKKEDG